MEAREITELEKALEQIWDVARRFGLDPYPVRFEVVPATVMYEVGSYSLPGRYSHWTFGKAYHRMKTMYDFGLSKIYEVVINTNPSYGFLLETNSPVQNRSEEHTSELQSRSDLVCRLLLEKKKITDQQPPDLQPRDRSYSEVAFRPGTPNSCRHAGGGRAALHRHQGDLTTCDELSAAATT